MQPGQENIALSVQAGHQQIGQEMFVTIAFNIGTMNFSVSMPIQAAKHTSKIITDAAENAAKQIIKPASLVSN